jgi:hypothetical protein
VASALLSSEGGDTESDALVEGVAVGEGRALALAFAFAAARAAARAAGVGAPAVPLGALALLRVVGLAAWVVPARVGLAARVGFEPLAPPAPPPPPPPLDALGGALVGFGVGVDAVPLTTGADAPGFRCPDEPCQAQATEPFFGTANESTPCWE